MTFLHPEIGTFDLGMGHLAIQSGITLDFGPVGQDYRQANYPLDCDLSGG